MFSDKQRECFIKLCVHVYYTINTSQKAYGCDDLSINMIKICYIEIVKPLYLTYMKCLKTGRFPSSWKKANVLPIHNKESRQLKKNYVPTSLLLICWKIFEKLIFDTTYKYLYENQLLTLSQSGFRPGDSTENQFLSTTHKIYSAFEEFPSRESRAVFLDVLTKCGMMASFYKLKSYGISLKTFQIIVSNVLC